MFSKNSLNTLAVLLPLMITMIPSVPLVYAQGTGSEIAITPASNIGALTTSFSPVITLANVAQLTGYDVVINYNQTVLMANSVTAGDWCNAASCFTVVSDISQGTGTIEFSQVVLGGAVDITNSNLFSVSFTFQASGSTPLTISDVSLTGLVGGVVTLLPTPTIVNAEAHTPPAATAALIKWKARADFRTLNVTHDGDTQTLFGNAANTGLNPAYVMVEFVITSATGSVTIKDTPVVLIAVGGTAIASVSFGVPLISLHYYVEARLMVSGDGIHFNFSGSTKTFHYGVTYKV